MAISDPESCEVAAMADHIDRTAMKTRRRESGSDLDLPNPRPPAP